MPHALWDYMNNNARQSADALRSVSEKQHAKIDEGSRTSIDSFAGSDALRAMQADVEVFGDAAFTRGADGDE